ncbi:MAG: phage portal protein [Chlorobiaceae bacterium]
MSEPTRRPISDTLLQTVIRGGQFIDPTQEWMGPNRPMAPSAPPEVAGRQFDYPVGYNIQVQPREAEPVTFKQLRALADNLDLLRLVIETRKDLVCSLAWEIRPKDEGKEPDDRCKAVQDMLQLPDREHTWTEWLRMVLEDLFVLDAPCLYPRLTKGGQLYALEPIDGATITRKIDQTGRTPLPPEIAYQQVLKGVPAGDFTRDELIYRPRNLRTSRIYGFSPVEQIIMTVNIALRRQLSQLQYYTEGSTPDLILSVPVEWSTEQATSFRAHWHEMLNGNTGARRQTQFVPGGVSLINTKESMLKDEYDEWLARVITYAFSVPNQPFVKQMNRSTAETAQDQAVSEGLLPVLNWVKSLIEYVLIRYFGYADLTLAWVDNKDPDLLQAAQIDLLKAQAEQIRINSGVLDENEVRLDLGLSELTPEQMLERNPPPPPQLQDVPNDPKTSPDQPQQGKVEKKSAIRPDLLTETARRCESSALPWSDTSPRT